MVKSLESDMDSLPSKLMDFYCSDCCDGSIIWKLSTSSKQRRPICFNIAEVTHWKTRFPLKVGVITRKWFQTGDNSQSYLEMWGIEPWTFEIQSRCSATGFWPIPQCFKTCWKAAQIRDLTTIWKLPEGCWENGQGYSTVEPLNWKADWAVPLM